MCVKQNKLSHKVAFMNISEIKQFLSFQSKALDSLEFLIKYDREQALKNNEPAEKTIVLKAFIDTQRKSLDVANRLLLKHESSLIQEEKAKAEQERRTREQAYKMKAQQQKPVTALNLQQPQQSASADSIEVGLFDTLDGEYE